MGIYLGFDANNYIAAAWHATQGNGNRTAASMFSDFVSMMSERVNPVHRMCAFDGPREKCFRKSLFPEYKANRPPRPEDLGYQLERAKDILIKRGIQWTCLEEFEADDVLATYAQKAADSGFRCIITSTDKDMFQILRKGSVALYRKLPGVRPEFDTNNVYTEDHFTAEHGLTPDQWVSHLALAGDSSDGWPGAKGIGPVAAKKWIFDENLTNRQRDSINSLDLNLARRMVCLVRDCPFEIIKERCDQHEVVI